MYATCKPYHFPHAFEDSSATAKTRLPESVCSTWLVCVAVWFGQRDECDRRHDSDCRTHYQSISPALACVPVLDAKVSPQVSGFASARYDSHFPEESTERGQGTGDLTACNARRPCHQGNRLIGMCMSVHSCACVSTLTGAGAVPAGSHEALRRASKQTRCMHRAAILHDSKCLHHGHEINKYIHAYIHAHTYSPGRFSRDALVHKHNAPLNTCHADCRRRQLTQASATTTCNSAVACGQRHPRRLDRHVLIGQRRPAAVAL